MTPQLDDSRYFQSVHRLGRITVFLALTCFIGLAFALSFLQNIPFDVGTALQNGVPILLTFSISGIIENLSFAPIIGCAALYMACVTGNVSNMKAPAAMNAMEVSGAQPGTPKGDVISMIAIASSTFVTVTVVFLGMLFLAPLFAPLYENPFCSLPLRTWYLLCLEPCYSRRFSNLPSRQPLPCYYPSCYVS